LPIIRLNYGKNKSLDWAKNNALDREVFKDLSCNESHECPRLAEPKIHSPYSRASSTKARTKQPVPPEERLALSFSTQAQLGHLSMPISSKVSALAKRRNQVFSS
jgi:hypothetical protein